MLQWTDMQVITYDFEEYFNIEEGVVSYPRGGTDPGYNQRIEEFFEEIVNSYYNNNDCKLFTFGRRHLN